MKLRPLTSMAAAGLMLTSLATSAWAEAPKMKMTTPVPDGVAMPDSVNTRLGTLKFTDGFPHDATVQKVLDNLDFQRGVQTVLTSIPAASLHAMREGIRTFGPVSDVSTYRTDLGV